MIPSEHLQLETWPPRKGGQQVGGAYSGVKITHLPSGIVAIVDIGRSQFKNREIAIDMILSAITHKDYRL